MARPRETEPPLPPQNLDAEESILGAMMLSTAAIDAVSEIVTGRDFYRASHSMIFDVCLELHAAGEPVDAITVADRLDAKGALVEIGGKKRIHEIAALVPSSANAAHYARIVREVADFRNLTVVGEQIQRIGWERAGTGRDAMESAERLVFGLATERERGDFVEVADLLSDAYARLTALYESGEKITGLSVGLPSIDDYTSGFQDENLIVVAARPSMGKSALALTFSTNIAVRSGRPVGIFTLEMSKSEITQRLIALEGLVDLRNVLNGRLGPEEWEKVVKVISRLQQAPILIDDTKLLTITELRSKARRLKLRRPDLAMIVVDYLQLMTAAERAETRNVAVGEISRSLKILAGELGIPIVVVSQLSRQVEQRHDKRPILSDLRESGAIEQDADVILFVYRDEYYHPEDTDQHGIAEVEIAKQRQGPTGTVKLAFLKRYVRFSELPRPGAGDPT